MSPPSVDLLIGAHHSIAGGTPRAVDHDRANLAALRRLSAAGPPAE